jgi:hypothetical protein
VGLLIAVIFAGAIIARTNSPAPVPHFENTLIAVVNGRPTGCPVMRQDVQSASVPMEPGPCRWTSRVSASPNGAICAMPAEPAVEAAEVRGSDFGAPGEVVGLRTTRRR